MKRKNTSWGHVAYWYNALLKEEGTYQKEVILPNLLRLMDLKPDEIVLDLACGQGFFTREFAKFAAKAIGVDISPELIAIARELSGYGQSPSRGFPPPSGPGSGNHARPVRPKQGAFTGGQIEYVVSSADNLDFLPAESVDKAALVLALGNIENVRGVFIELRRVLRPSGAAYIVLNHPAFRIPRMSSWGWDEKARILYRRLDRYMSESTSKIQMHPGSRPHVYTITFHRPLQWYFKHLTNCGFCVTRLEEWISNRKSQPGPRAEAENTARNEFPLFLFIEARPFPSQR
ncbi:MAG TPA: methyltransferase domain-containing protein [Firmicutes bacterium]|nr:methyltransferase domain-containing protein [Candidatus Fermentithermobacillaceae bacterium]